jgi:predicted nucleic acid-binding protein
MKENLSVYDTVYIALASKLKLPILTLDSSRLEIAKRNKVKIAEISDI